MDLASLSIPSPALPGPATGDPAPQFQLASVTVLAPAGGISVAAGQALAVQWETIGDVDAHAVLLSTDGGTSFGNVTGADLPGSARSFTFVLPAPPLAAVQAVVRVRAKRGGSGVARGDSAPFTLTEQDLQAPQVVVTAPVAGQVLVVGVASAITWTSSDNVALESHKVLLSTDGGASFRDISPLLPGDARSFVYTPAAADSSAQVRLRVAARDGAGNRGTGDTGPVAIAVAAPLIDRILPPQAHAEQGVLIQGRRLGSVRQVLFGGTLARFRVVDAFSVEARVPILRSPQQGPLQVNVSVQADAGAVTAPEPFTVTPLPVPRIDRLEPDTAAAGEPVRLVGSGLLQIGAAPTTLTFFDGVPAPFIRSDPAGSGNFIETQVPAGARSGPLRLVTPGGSATVAFTLRASVQAPVIDSIAPGSGLPGTAVTITGRGFNGVSTADPQRGVFFKGPAGELRALLLGASDTTVIAQVPAGSISGPVRLQADGGTASSPAPFAVPAAAASVVLGVAPAAAAVAPGGSVSYTVTIARTNADGPVALTVSGLPAGAAASFSPNPASGGSAQLTVTTSPGATPSGPWTLTIGGSIAGSGAPVTPATAQLSVGVAPAITGFAPAGGAPGTAVRIDGSGFVDLVAVDLGGAVLLDVRANAAGSRIDATLPPQANTGRFLVRTASGSALSDGVFIVDTTVPPPPPPPPTTGAPSISAVRPLRGRVGTPVAIAGSGFVDGATSLAFDGVQAALTVVDATRLATVVPPGARTGPVTVSTPGGSAVSPVAFSVV